MLTSGLSDVTGASSPGVLRVEAFNARTARPLYRNPRTTSGWWRTVVKRV